MKQIALQKPKPIGWQVLLIVAGMILLFTSSILWLKKKNSAKPVQTAPVTAEVVAQTPTDDYVSLALRLAKTGDVDGAMDALGIAIASGKDGSAEAYYYRGLIQAEQGLYAKALADFDSGIAADPHMPAMFAARGTTYASLGRPATALEDFSQAIELDPAHAATYVNRGQAYLDMGEPNLAMIDFDHALSLDDTLTAAYFNRGTLYLERSESEKALDDFDKCVENSPEAPAPFFNRAVAYMNLNNLEAAAADLVIYMSMTQDEEGRHQAEALLNSLVDYEANSHLDVDASE